MQPEFVLAGPVSLCELSALPSAVMRLSRLHPAVHFSRDGKCLLAATICNLHVVFVADIRAEATPPISLVLLYLSDTQAAGWIDDVNKQLCVGGCKPLRQRSFVTEFMVAADGL